MFKLLLCVALVDLSFGGRIPESDVRCNLYKPPFCTRAPTAGRVVFFGDSITDWFDRDGTATWNNYYGSLLAANVAVAGDRTQTTIDRINGGNIDNYNIETAVLMIGTNDLSGGLEVQYVADKTLEIINLIKEHNPEVKVLLLGIFPRNGEAIHTNIRAVNELTSQYANGEDIFYLDMSSKFENGLGVVKPELYTDGLHLSAAGYVEWARTMAPQFNQIYAPSYRGKVVFLGDSITQGWNGQPQFAEKYVPLGVVNNGVSGDVTQQTIDRINQGNLDGLDARLVVIKIGTNDLSRNTPEAIIVNNIGTIITLVLEKCPNANILLLGILPRTGVDIATRAENVNSNIANFENVWAQVSYLNMRDQFQIDVGVVDPDIMPDGLHLSTAGYQIWADTMDPLFNLLLNKDL